MELISSTEVIMFLKSFVISTLILIYIFNLPKYITNNENLVNEYYFSDKTIQMLILDVFLISIYFFISITIINQLKIENFWTKVLICMMTTFIISFTFYKYFLSKPLGESFFSRWFYTVGEKAVLYDVVFLSLMFIIFLQLNE